MSLLAEVLPQLLVLESSSDSEGSEYLLLLSGPAAGAALYWSLFRYYRNIDKSHNFEHETAVQAKPITGQDQKVDHIRGTREAHTKGRNENSYRARVQRIP